MSEQRKVALVTGGSRGIGLGIARCLAADGFDLAINGVRGESDNTVILEDLKNTGVDVLYCQGDISEATDRERMIDAIKVRFGRLNLLVNNAGVAPNVRADILDATEESYERVMRINLQGPYFLTQAAARWMIDQRESNADFTGSIVNISSISATVASPNRGEYCISKAGISMATQLWAVRLGEFGIPVYEVRPGIIATDMTATVKDKYDSLFDQGMCVQPRWGQPEDVGRAVASIARGDFPYSTGNVFMVDGGLTVERL